MASCFVLFRTEIVGLWNTFTSHSTSTPSAFEVFFTANALYKLLTYLFTYLLTYYVELRVFQSVVIKLSDFVSWFQQNGPDFDLCRPFSWTENGKERSGGSSDGYIQVHRKSQGTIWRRRKGQRTSRPQGSRRRLGIRYGLQRERHFWQEDRRRMRRMSSHSSVDMRAAGYRHIRIFEAKYLEK